MEMDSRLPQYDSTNIPYIKVNETTGEILWPPTKVFNSQTNLIGGEQMDIISIKGILLIAVITFIVNRLTLKRLVRFMKNLVWKPTKSKYEEAKKEWNEC